MQLKIRVGLLLSVLLLSIANERLNKEVVEPSSDIKFVQTVAMIQHTLEKFAKDKTIAHQIAFYIAWYSREKNQSPLLITAIVLEESRANYKAVGKAGEISLMQIHPRFWRGVFPSCGKDLFNIKTNICYGTNIFHIGTTKQETTDLAIGWYNGNPRNKIYVGKINKRLQLIHSDLLKRNWTLCPRENQSIES